MSGQSTGSASSTAPSLGPVVVKDVIQKTTQFFRDKGFESPRLDTELLIASALQWERMKIYLNYEYPLSETELTQCRELVRRRATGEPVAYILGRKDFFGHTFKVSSSVLIPRPDTETLVEKAIEWVGQNPTAHRIVDIGTGSGCIGLSLLAALPETKLLAVDVSPAALEVAKENASSLQLQERVTFLERDAANLSADVVQGALGELADLVVANPPYISPSDPEVQPNVKKFEPNLALFSEGDGLQHISDWCAVAAQLVRPGGFVIFEIGHLQGSSAREIFSKNGNYDNIEIVRDLSGQERCVRAVRRSGDGKGS